jgi:hypothetical protein
MADLQGQETEVEFTIEIKRAATGKIETYKVTGRLEDNGSNTPSSGIAGSNKRGDGTDRD